MCVWKKRKEGCTVAECCALVCGCMLRHCKYNTSIRKPLEDDPLGTGEGPNCSYVCTYSAECMLYYCIIII